MGLFVCSFVSHSLFASEVVFSSIALLASLEPCSQMLGWSGKSLGWNVHLKNQCKWKSHGQGTLAQALGD